MSEAIFKTDDGEYDVSKMSLAKQHIFVLAQRLLTEIKTATDDVECKKAALEWFKSQLLTECNDDTKIEEDD